MTEKSNEESQVPEFKKIIAGYTDDELRKALKKRKLYRKEAADFAVQEAIRRGMIYSEQDLFAVEFKPEPEKFSLFPKIENEQARAKYKKSISRSLLILGALPLVWGSIEIFEKQNIEGVLIFIFGVTWSFTTFQLMSRLKMKPKLIYFMFVLAALAIVYLLKTLIKLHSLTPSDVLAGTIAAGFVFYAIGFLNSLKD
jgi:hypothetical protein